MNKIVTQNFFKCSNEKLKIYYFKNEVIKPKAIIHLVHGAIDHFNRYKSLIKYFTQNKILVYGMDLRGHGITGKNSQFGYFGKKGYQKIWNDIHKLNQIIKHNHPELKIFLLGHSMGSMIIRSYITKFQDYNGIITIGTNHKSKFLSLLLKYLPKLFKPLKSNNLINTLTFNSFQKKFKNENPYAWLAKNKQVSIDYQKDNLTNFKMTNSSFSDIGSWMNIFITKKNHNFVNRNLPILFLNGLDDPVSNFGKEVAKASKFYLKLGFKNFHHIPYENFRHEIHNEKQNDIVFKAIMNFIKDNN